MYTLVLEGTFNFNTFEYCNLLAYVVRNLLLFSQLESTIPHVMQSYMDVFWRLYSECSLNCKSLLQSCSAYASKPVEVETPEESMEAALDVVSS